MALLSLLPTSQGAKIRVIFAPWAVEDGSLGPAIEAVLQDLNPEAAYFWPEDGERSGMVVFDMADSSQIPRIAERLFMNLDAAVQFMPVMNADDLKKGLGNLSS